MKNFHSQQRKSSQKHYLATPHKSTCIMSFLLLCLVLAMAGPLWAADLHVGSGQTYSTIASAISSSNSGDTIIIHAGTYNEYNLRPKSNTILKGNDADNMPVIIGYGDYIEGPNHHTFRCYGSDNVTFQYLDIRDGKTCISIADNIVTDITIKNCKLSITGWSSSYAPDNAGCITISPGAKNIVIRNNIIESNKAGVMGVIGFRSDGSITIENNKISLEGDAAGGKSCCGIFWKHAGSATTQMVIQNNDIHVTGSKERNGGIWIVNDNVLVHNNLVYGSMRDGIDFYVTSGMGPPGGSNCIATHNTVYGAIRSGSLYAHEFSNGGTNNTYYNNIFYGVNPSAHQTFSIWRDAESGNHNTTSDYNCYYSSVSSTPIQKFGILYNLADWKTHSGQDTHSVQEKPQFANGSGNLNTKMDFEITGGNANNGASDGKDMGADISLVGPGGNSPPGVPGAPPWFK